ncbi:hypothetical protein [Desulfurobacterium sp.]
MKNPELNYTQADFSKGVNCVADVAGVASEDVKRAIANIKKPIPPLAEELAFIVVSHIMDVIDREGL